MGVLVRWWVRGSGPVPRVRGVFRGKIAPFRGERREGELRRGDERRRSGFAVAVRSFFEQCLASDFQETDLGGVVDVLLGYGSPNELVERVLGSRWCVLVSCCGHERFVHLDEVLDYSWIAVFVVEPGEVTRVFKETGEVFLLRGMVLQPAALKPDVAVEGVEKVVSGTGRIHVAQRLDHVFRRRPRWILREFTWADPAVRLLPGEDGLNLEVDELLERLVSGDECEASACTEYFWVHGNVVCPPRGWVGVAVVQLTSQAVEACQQPCRRPDATRRQGALGVCRLRCPGARVDVIVWEPIERHDLGAWLQIDRDVLAGLFTGGSVRRSGLARCEEDRSGEDQEMRLNGGHAIKNWCRQGPWRCVETLTRERLVLPECPRLS